MGSLVRERCRARESIREENQEVGGTHVVIGSGNLGLEDIRTLPHGIWKFILTFRGKQCM